MASDREGYAEGWSAGRASVEDKMDTIRAELEQVKREIDKLSQYFRDEAPSDGFEGDVEGWSPVDTAIVVMRRNRNAERLAGERVRALDWRGTEGVWAKADALFGATYRITEYAGMAKPFKLETVGFVGPHGHYELIEEAKAVAQADYERRILSALAEPAGEAEPEQVGWAYRDKRWDEDRWHVCGWEKPREAEGREVRPIFIGTTPPDASAIREALDIPECVLSLCADKITLSFESGEDARCAFDAIEAALAGAKP